MFVFRGGLRFSFRALEVPEPRMRKRSFSLKCDKSILFYSMFLPPVRGKYHIDGGYLYLPCVSLKSRPLNLAPIQNWRGGSRGKHRGHVSDRLYSFNGSRSKTKLPSLLPFNIPKRSRKSTRD